MPLIEWKDGYALGIAEIDHEHRELIELLNELYARLIEDGGDVADLLGEVFARISAHFALEESTMRTLDYPETAAHKADHERLLDEIRDLMDDYEDGRQVDADALSARLDAWFNVHFRTFDARLHAHGSH